MKQRNKKRLMAVIDYLTIEQSDILAELAETFYEEQKKRVEPRLHSVAGRGGASATILQYPAKRSTA